MTRNKLILVAITVSIAVSLEGQQQSVYVDFTAEEFRQRRDKVFDRIGDNAMALIQGAPSSAGFSLFRQSNTFYYLTGLKTPHAYLLMDGRSRKTVAYLPHRDPDHERSVGKVLSAEDASTVMRLTGVDEVRGVEALSRLLVRAQLRPPPPDLYVPFAPRPVATSCSAIAPASPLILGTTAIPDKDVFYSGFVINSLRSSCVTSPPSSTNCV